MNTLKMNERMNRFFRFLTLAIIVISYLSCGNDDGIELGELGEDYLVFGHFYGECGGEGCVETYALTNDKLYEDTNDKYRGIDFNFIELEYETYEKIKDLGDQFPDELLTEVDETIGCPDCGDWGGILVQFVKKGETKTWYIDLQTDDVPEYLNEFTKIIREKIAIINE